MTSRPLLSRQLTGRKIIGQPSGEIVQVDRGSGTVWINLGRADSLSQQVTFRVYPADLSDLKIEGNKGSIEVTHVLGDHLAEARVTDDKLADPILPGDKVYTPLWNPGQKRHFALAGFFNIDGRGQPKRPAHGDQPHQGQSLHGGLLYRGQRRAQGRNGRQNHGEHQLSVLGIPPDDKADPREILAFTQMRKTADHLRIPIMQFNDMLQEMGWKNGAPMIRYGGGIPTISRPGRIRTGRRNRRAVPPSPAPAAQFVELEHPAVRRLEWIELYSLLTRTGGGMTDEE